MRDGSAPGQRRDGFKVGLVVEGGGMRGVVSGAALQAMHDLGLRCVLCFCLEISSPLCCMKIAEQQKRKQQSKSVRWCRFDSNTAVVQRAGILSRHYFLNCSSFTSLCPDTQRLKAGKA